ncbi:MAG: amino acid deaminase/aldolase [Mycobacterium sp.]|nr:amino acid deaminase/aldolase [Mycobacterium sp.]
MTDSRYETLHAATEHLQPPFGVLDADALAANAADMVHRANGTPIRLASKSIRCREVLRTVLAIDGFHGILAFTLPEALWLADEFDDIVVGYPSTDVDALRALAASPTLAQRITLMVDSVDHLDYIDAALGDRAAVLRVCIDIDASLRVAGGRAHIGARRPPVHTVGQAQSLARAVVERPGYELVGLLSYEAQIAGVGDNPPGARVRSAAVRAMQHVSRRELRERRAAVVTAIREIAPLEFVNGGGTGTLESTSTEEAVTEIAAGSGLYGPALFDTYRHFRPRPAAFFVLPVVRRPTTGIATVLGGGWIASGASGADRLPTPAWPPGLALIPAEGAGEVQTPLRGAGAHSLRIGDRVWFRHAKAGELCERIDHLHVVDGEYIGARVATYRGEQKAFL